MEKKSKKPVVIILIVAAVLVVAAVVVFFIINNQKGYRLLKVFEVDGKANVNRESLGDIEPYANMVLESGDVISLETGNLTICADDDKYIYLEEDTEIVLNATAKGKKAKTDIELRKGAITNDIRNRLTNGSTYEINTPNSTMFVRGTSYRVWVYEIDGVRYTRVSVFDGEVVTRLVYKDGTVADEEVTVSKGKEVIIYEDDKVVKYLSDPTDIDYDTLPEGALEILLIINDNGRDLSITNPEINVILYGPYTVTFMYGNTVFGTQTVKKGDKATIPSLQPAASGSWDFDFSKPITKNTTIKWK